MSTATDIALWSVRRYGERAGDYHTISGWLEARGHPPLPETLLPQCGVVIELNEAPAAAGWCYYDTSVGVALPHWMVISPALGLRLAREAAGLLDAAISDMARSSGYSVLMTFTLPTLAREWQRLGWQQLSDSPCVQMGKRID